MCQPVPIDVNGIIDSGVSIVDIAAGRAHSLILTSEGNVFSFGHNGYGQCGRPVIENEKYSGSKLFHNVEVPEKIARVFAGQDHNILLSENGTLWTFGISTDGQLGRPSSRGFDHKPLPVEGPLKGSIVTDVSCRADTVLVTTKKGELFGWGNNEYGQILPVESAGTQVVSPTLMKVNKHGSVISAAAGSTSCVAINERNQV